MTRRKKIAFLVLLVWVATLGMHVRREYHLAPGERLALGARSLAPGSHWYVVRLGDATIGFAATTLDTLASGFRLTSDLVLDVPALDTVTRAESQVRLELDDSLSLRAFEFRLASSVGRYAVSGVAEESDELVMDVEAGGPPTRLRERVPGGALLEGVIPLRLAASGGLEPGKKQTVRVFDPSTLSARDIGIEVTATDTLVIADSVALGADGRWVAAGMDTVPVWLLEQTYSGLKVSTWVDEDGLPVRAESPVGFTIERTAFELARQSFHESGSNPEYALGYGVVIEGTAVASGADVKGIEQADSLALRLTGVDLTGFDLAGAGRSLRGDTLVIRRPRAAEWREAGYSLPYRGTAPEVLRELESTPLIQARDERIRRAAREAVRWTRDPAEAAARLTEWVHGAVRKEIAASVPSALHVLDARRGDCNEHTVLFVALARSIGLPARTAVGLVHVNGRFYYHAWPEVYLNGEWVGFDPTLGQTPADASHVRFLVGGLARQVELIRLIGRLRLEVLG